MEGNNLNQNEDVKNIDVSQNEQMNKEVGMDKPPKKNMVPLIIIMVLLIGIGIGVGYYFGTKGNGGSSSTNTSDKNSKNSGKDNNNTNNTDNDDKQNSENKKELYNASGIKVELDENGEAFLSYAEIDADNKSIVSNVKSYLLVQAGQSDVCEGNKRLLFVLNDGTVSSLNIDSLVCGKKLEVKNKIANLNNVVAIRDSLEKSGTNEPENHVIYAQTSDSKEYNITKVLTGESNTAELKKENETKEDNKDTRVAYGTDKNTSGKKITDTKTKKITLNNKEYELKIEVLASNDGTKLKYQNVYFNGYKFISDQVITKNMTYVESDNYGDLIESDLKNELANVKILKDTANGDEYFVFRDSREAYGETKYLYILKNDGTLLKKIIISFGDSGIYVESNVNDSAFETRTVENPNLTPDYKYTLGLNGMFTIGLDSVYYISSYTCLSNMEKMTVDVNKLVVTNGNVKVNVYKTFTDGKEYNVGAAGATLCEDTGVKHQIN